MSSQDHEDAGKDLLSWEQLLYHPSQPPSGTQHVYEHAMEIVLVDGRGWGCPHRGAAMSGRFVTLGHLSFVVKQASEETFLSLWSLLKRTRPVSIPLGRGWSPF